MVGSLSKIRMLPEHIASHRAYDVSLFPTAESYGTAKKKSK